MFATSPPAESVHALDHSALKHESMTFWTAREDGVLLGCGALKALSSGHAEIKSMRTASLARGRGVATQMLEHIVAEAARMGYERVSLETGTEDYFAPPARRLYARHGFTECPPFGGDYTLDPNSVFMELAVSPK